MIVAHVAHGCPQGNLGAKCDLEAPTKGPQLCLNSTLSMCYTKTQYILNLDFCTVNIIKICLQCLKAAVNDESGKKMNCLQFCYLLGINGFN